MWFVLIGLAAVVIGHTAPFPFLLEYVRPRRSLWEGPKGDGGPADLSDLRRRTESRGHATVLDVLAREGASATFFVIPGFVTAETAPLVWRAVDEGHGVALHSGTRALMLKAPDDLGRAARGAGRPDRGAERSPAVPAVPPPRRLARQEMYEGLDRAGYRLAGWGFALWDFNWWRAPQPERLAARLAKRVSDGSIVVMHDGHHKNPRADRRRTATATAALIPLLKQRGFCSGRCARRAVAGASSHDTGDPTAIAPLVDHLAESAAAPGRRERRLQPGQRLVHLVARPGLAEDAHPRLADAQHAARGCRRGRCRPPAGWRGGSPGRADRADARSAPAIDRAT